MIPRRRSLLLLALSCAACPASDEKKPADATTDAAASSGSRPEPMKPEPTKPEQVTPQPLAAVEVLVGVGDCPPLPALPASASEAQRALVPVLEAARAVSCEPAVFGRSLAEVRTKLGIPDAMPFELGRRYANFELGEAPVLVSDLLAVMGARGAKMTLDQGMMPVWEVEVGTWAPGVVTIPIRADRHESQPDGAVAEVPADTAVTSFIVRMPAEAIRFADDPHAAPLLVAALTELSNRPELLKKEPAEIRAELETLGERFVLHRYAEGLGEQQVLGASMRPLRTELVAADLAKALGLSAATHETIPIYDADPDRLASDGQTSFLWNGLWLEIELDEREGLGLGLHRWVVTDIQVMPGQA